MKTIERGWHSRGYLPHFDGGEIPQMVTFRLIDSLPRALYDAWKLEVANLPIKDAETECRRRIEAYLDKGLGKAWLSDKQIAQMVENALLHFDGERYRVHAWVVMPNHVHILFTPCGAFTLEDILHSWKSFTAKQANRMLRQTGKFWQEEYFDRFIRDEFHFARTLEYIEFNPVKASLCQDSREWRFSSARYRVTRNEAGETPALPGKL